MMRGTVARRVGLRLRALLVSALSSFAVVVGVGGAWAGVGASAWAQSTTLRGSVSTSQGPTAQQSITDNPNASLSDLQSEDAVGNDAVAGGTLEAFDGRFNLFAHGCSGGAPGNGGQANALAECTVLQEYLVVSETLPAGTPVTVLINWSVTGRATAAGNLTYWAYGAAGTLNGQVSITVGGVSIINVSGERRREYNTQFPSGYNHFIYGTLNTEEDSREHMVTALVGQGIRIFMRGTATGVSIAGAPDVADGDAQLSMNWGITSENPDASIVSTTYPGESVPPADGATPGNSIINLPDRPPGLPECFTFSSQPEPESACDSTSTGFSVSVDGTGPFHYQWYRDNIVIDGDANPSAETATLMLTDITAGDAGTYTVVVTNPCGSRTSQAVWLTVGSPPTISAQPVSTSGCESGTASFSVAVDAEAAPYYYEWYRNNIPVDADANPSAVTAMLMLSGITADDAGSYTVEVSNPCGTATSEAAVLTVSAPPAISTDPASASVCTPDAASVSVVASGPDIFYQWQIETSPGEWGHLGEDPINLPCGGAAATSEDNAPSVQISITPCPGVSQYQVRAVVSNECGSVPSSEATITVESCCAPDFNGDGNVGVPDIFAFLAAWFAGDVTADFDGSGLPVAVPDIFAFLSAWFAGCP